MLIDGLRRHGLLLAVLAGNLLLRARLLEVPLERDEGVYAYIAQRILAGVPLYTETVDLQMPGLWLCYAAFLAAFGETAAGVHTGLLLASELTVLLVYGIALGFSRPGAAAFAAATYALLSLGRSVLGFSANAEHFVVLPALAGLLLLQRATASWRPLPFLLSGVLLGLSAGIKQQGALFALVGAVALAFALVTRRRRGDQAHAVALPVYLAGVALPLVAFALWFAARGVFGEFWFWSVAYPLQYAGAETSIPTAKLLARSGTLVLRDSWALFAWSALGLGTAVFELARGGRRRAAAVFVLTLSGGSLLGLAPYFRYHYYVLVLPAVALLAALALEHLLTQPHRWLRVLATLLAGLSLAQPLWTQRGYLFALAPEEIVRIAYPWTPFAASPGLAERLRQRSAPGDRIAILGSEPQILFYSGIPSAIRQVVMYPLIWGDRELAHGLERRTIAEMEAVRPRFVVLVRAPSSWGLRLTTRADDPRFAQLPLLEWASEYTREGFRRIGVVDFLDARRTVTVWGDEAARYEPRSNRAYLVVLERDEPR
ncbi:MAG: hypothetical protein ACR2P8_11785 [Myxococcota bacterium]